MHEEEMDRCFKYIQQIERTEKRQWLNKWKNKPNVKICALLENYPADRGNSLPTFRDSLTLEDETDMSSRNGGKKLPLYAG